MELYPDSAVRLTAWLLAKGGTHSWDGCSGRRPARGMFLCANVNYTDFQFLLLFAATLQLTNARGALSFLLSFSFNALRSTCRLSPSSSIYSAYRSYLFQATIILDLIRVQQLRARGLLGPPALRQGGDIPFIQTRHSSRTRQAAKHTRYIMVESRVRISFEIRTLVRRPLGSGSVGTWTSLPGKFKLPWLQSCQSLDAEQTRTGVNEPRASLRDSDLGGGADTRHLIEERHCRNVC